jgi:hypothetical protein
MAQCDLYKNRFEFVGDDNVLAIQHDHLVAWLAQPFAR